MTAEAKIMTTPIISVTYEDKTYNVIEELDIVDRFDVKWYVISTTTTTTTTGERILVKTGPSKVITKTKKTSAQLFMDDTEYTPEMLTDVTAQPTDLPFVAYKCKHTTTPLTLREAELTTKQRGFVFSCLLQTLINVYRAYGIVCLDLHSGNIVMTNTNNVEILASHWIGKNSLNFVHDFYEPPAHFTKTRKSSVEWYYMYLLGLLLYENIYDKVPTRNDIEVKTFYSPSNKAVKSRTLDILGILLCTKWNKSYFFSLETFKTMWEIAFDIHKIRKDESGDVIEDVSTDESEDDDEDDGV